MSDRAKALMFASLFLIMVMLWALAFGIGDRFDSLEAQIEELHAPPP